jgi:hypothetical protein
MRVGWPALSILTPLAISGCSSYAPPRLGVSSARVTEQSPQATVVQFEIAAENTNAEELPLRQVRYSLAIDGREVFRGVRSPGATLRRLGTQTFTIPAVLVQPEGSPPPVGMHRYTLAGSLEYVTPGSIAQILFDIRVRRPSVSFREEGSIEFLPLEAPASPGPADPPAEGENSSTAGDS